MQGHSGEHIFSGTVHRLFGGENVGFHMGEGGMTLDFSVELSPEDIARCELEANRAVWADLPVRTLSCPPRRRWAGWNTAARRSSAASCA